MKRKLTHAASVLTRRLAAISAQRRRIDALKAKLRRRGVFTSSQHHRLCTRIDVAQAALAEMEFVFVVDAIEMFDVELEHIDGHFDVAGAAHLEGCPACNRKARKS